MVTELPFGNDATGLLLASVTSAPAAGAGPPRETVPVTVFVPPTTNVALVSSCAKSGGCPNVLSATRMLEPFGIITSGDPLWSKSPVAGDVAPPNPGAPKVKVPSPLPSTSPPIAGKLPLPVGVPVP